VFYTCAAEKKHMRYISAAAKTCAAVKSWTCEAGNSCVVYMCCSKKNVWYTCAAAVKSWTCAAV